MEKLSSSTFLPLFRFSNIWMILPYYGLLDKWDNLMTSLWTVTNRTWIENFDAFIEWSKDFKVKNDKYFSLSWLTPKEMHNSLSNWFEEKYDIIDELTLKCYVYSLLPFLTNDQLLIVRAINEKHNEWKIAIINKYKLSTVVPSFRWWVHKPEIIDIDYEHFNDALFRFKDNFLQRTFVISKKCQNKFEVKKYLNQIQTIGKDYVKYDYSNISKVSNMLNLCPDENWYCKPKILHFGNLNKSILSSFMEKNTWAKHINKIWIYSLDNENYFKYILSLISKCRQLEFWCNIDFVFLNQSVEYWIASESFSQWKAVIFNKNETYHVKFSFLSSYLSGEFINIADQNNEWSIIRILKLKFNYLKIKNDSNPNSDLDKIISNLRNSGEIWEKYCIAFHSWNLKNIITFSLKNLVNAPFMPKLQTMMTTFDFRSEDEENIAIKWLNSISRDWRFQLSIYQKCSWVFNSNKVWSLISSFSNIWIYWLCVNIPKHKLLNFDISLPIDPQNSILIT